jgi:hypothetical protein
MPFYVYGRTGSALATGGMFIAQMVPAIALGSLASVHEALITASDRRSAGLAP